ncbi:recombinase family protein [Breznakia pachnodae]|uniref:DNA invertase Pin-like site-specific DNA recombinase n=1 Tax=Breznakia pachnodae TaxID=265178 RepID=A0ABU0E503_9FIRM|nr:recombinase family protein [Breznakia pachnodae]MDQ0361977.1 DNA invertase Pin-like site-specific DNA recombinase [Breznakia pachnodae]
MKYYGYVRVSTKNQNIDRQMADMKRLEIPRQDIFIDKVSGKSFERPAYKRLLKKLKPNDVVFVKSIDRLGRNYDEIIRQWKFLTIDKDVDIAVIDFPLLDTRNQINGITGKFIADLVLQVLSYVAQVERENIRQRQAEGIREARKRGIRFGRPQKEKPDDFEMILQMWLDGTISQREAGRRLQISNHTFIKWVEHANEVHY